MADSHIYDEKKFYGKLLNEFLLKNIIPKVNLLLSDEDAISVYVLKLLNVLADKNKIFISALKK